MLKETYRVNCPNWIVFGDPLYFEQESKERLKELVADIVVPENFVARVVLEEVEIKGLPNDTGRVMSIFLAEDQTIKAFMQGKRFGNMDRKFKMIGVDSASYLLSVDGREEVIYTGGDGHWGSYDEYGWNTAEGALTAGIVVKAVMPARISMQEMRFMLSRLFDGVRKVQNVEKVSTVNKLKVISGYDLQRKSINDVYNDMIMG